MAVVWAKPTLLWIKFWQELFDGDLDVDKMIEEGKKNLVVDQYCNYHLVRSMAFEAEIDGLKCICSNMPQDVPLLDTLENRKQLRRHDKLLH